jgi:hypothetical protein
MPLAPTRTLRIPSRYAMSFDGVDDYVSIPHNSSIEFDGTKPFTVMFWAKPAAYDGVWRFVLSKRYIDASGRQGWEIHHHATSNVLRLQRFTDSTGNLLGIAYTPDIWQVFAWTYDGSSIKGYLNVGSISSTNLIKAGTANLIIAWTSYGSKDIINEVCIYNRALSADEISWNYQNFYNPVRAGLVLCLIADPQYIKDIDNDGILEWIDLSGLGNHGKIFGATLVDLFKRPVRTLPAIRTLPVAR